MGKLLKKIFGNKKGTPQANLTPLANKFVPMNVIPTQTKLQIL